MSTKQKGRSSQFLEKISPLAASSIKDCLARLSDNEKREVRRFALWVLQNSEQKKKEKLRIGAVRLIVALLPQSFPVLKKLLSDCSSPLWYEVQFTIFCSLDREDLKPADQKRILQLIHDYLLGIRRDAGYAAWMAGDLLGDHWQGSETVRILENIVVSARYAAGRSAALHGIEHALDHATPAETERLVAVLQKTASTDHSAAVRRRARTKLSGGGCGIPLTLPSPRNR